MNKVILGIIAVLIIGALGFMMFGGEDTESEMADNEQNTQETSLAGSDTSDVNDTKQISSNALVLGDNDNGKAVKVTYARLDKPGFVVLYKMNSQSDVAYIGSSELLLPGEYSDFSIPVNSALAKEQIITGVLYADEGNGEFNYPDEDFYLTNNYEVVTDIDVIQVDNEDESEEILEQAKAYVEANTSVEYE